MINHRGRFSYDRNAFVLTCVASSVTMSAFMIVVQRKGVMPDEEAGIVMLYILGSLMIATFVGLWSWLGTLSEGVDRPPEPRLSKRRLSSYAEIARNIVIPVIFLIGFLIMLVVLSRPSAG